MNAYAIVRRNFALYSAFIGADRYATSRRTTGAYMLRTACREMWAALSQKES